MGHWDVAGDARAQVDLSVEQTEIGAPREWSIYLAGRSLDAMTADDSRQVATALLDAAAALEAGQMLHAEAGA